MREEARPPWRETVRSLWFLPTVFILAALGAGYGLSTIDVAEGGMLESVVFGGDASAARELLIVVSGTMITVTGLVFVLTVVALQIASTQFSPRLLRSFLQDPGTRLVLSVFVATFAYSLGGLFTVGQTTDTGTRFVPRIAVTGSLMLALLSVGMLVYYIQHITNSIRIDTVMLGVRRATTQAIHSQYASPATDQPDRSERPAHDDAALEVMASAPGYVQEVDSDALVRLAADLDLTIELKTQVGHHLVPGTPVARVGSGDPAAVNLRAVTDGINGALTTAHERRVERDVGFGVRQLVDIALRAVAPSINDPYTAVQAIQHLSVVMAELASVSADHFRHHVDGRVRVFVPVPGFDVFLNLICMNMRRNAAHRPRVMVELLRLLETSALLVDSKSRRAEIARQIELVWRAVERNSDERADLDWVRSFYVAAASAATTGKRSNAAYA